MRWSSNAMSSSRSLCSWSSSDVSDTQSQRDAVLTGTDSGFLVGDWAWVSRSTSIRSDQHSHRSSVINWQYDHISLQAAQLISMDLAILTWSTQLGESAINLSVTATCDGAIKSVLVVSQLTEIQPLWGDVALCVISGSSIHVGSNNLEWPWMAGCQRPICPEDLQT